MSQSKVRSHSGLRKKCDRPLVPEESAIAPWSQNQVRLGASQCM
ncbi:MAG: hypothetical protein AB4352_11130 [Hormoscilla sp.]